MTRTSEGVTASCHCGAVAIVLKSAPTEITECNCSLCRAYGVRWLYEDADFIENLPDAALTDTYAWNGKHVDFHRCTNCGCVTHWMPREGARKRRGINARLLPKAVADAARLRHLDGANTGKYVD